MSLQQKGGFFMDEYRLYNNENLLVLARLDDKHALDELIRRFYNSSKKEAGALIRMYRDVSTAEFDDLVQIGIIALNQVINSYDFKGSVFTYWQKLARNEMFDEIRRCSTMFYDERTMIKTRIEGLTEENERYIACDDDISQSVANNNLIELIVSTLKNYKENGMKHDEIRFFILYYFERKSINQLVEMTGKQYFTIRAKIERVRKKLKDILANFIK